MLELKNISKTYNLNDSNTQAIHDINIKFRENEFVSILGPSGGGKTTLLNIIGGLDRYTTGDLIINGKSTKDFTSRDWDSYRNNKIGFVFQSYNLIPHLTILKNVELSLSLSGITSKERKQRAKDVLKQVGLEHHLNKKPNQLSGGQMQRVAIARALVNNPDILLADEPTGALDSKTSIEVMELIKKISKNRLVIMVTHNAEIANKYSTRIINLLDGRIINDSNPYNDEIKPDMVDTIKKSAMSFFTALSLSFNNLITKIGRTLLIAFAGSIGITGILLVLAISNGLNNYIDSMQSETLGGYPLSIPTVTINYDNIKEAMQNGTLTEGKDDDKEVNIYKFQDILPKLGKYNLLNNDYQEFIKSYFNDEENNDKFNEVQLKYSLDLKILAKKDDRYVKVDTSEKTSSIYGTTSSLFYEGLTNLDFIYDSYDIVSGNYPKDKNDVLLVLDNSNSLSTETMDKLGLKYEYETIEDENGNKTIQIKPISYEDFIGKEFRVISNDQYYTYDEGNDKFIELTEDNYSTVYNNISEDNILKISGILKQKEDANNSIYQSGILYTKEFADYMVLKNKESQIYKLSIQNNKIYKTFSLDISEVQSFLGNLASIFSFNSVEEIKNIVKTIFKFDISNEDALNLAMQAIGSSSIPQGIYIYTKDFKSKKLIKEYLDTWEGNNEQDSNYQPITYSDISGTLTNSLGNLINIVSKVLIAFSAISLVVSSIMIGVITYVSVVERTKEIGILRSIGARKKDITRVFNSETFIIGLLSGLIAIILSLIILLPLNGIIPSDYKDLYLHLNMNQILFMLLLSIVLTVLSGLIPSFIASKKDPVIALRTE